MTCYIPLLVAVSEGKTLQRERYQGGGNYKWDDIVGELVLAFPANAYR